MGNFKKTNGNITELFKQGQFDVIVELRCCDNFLIFDESKELLKQFPDILQADENMIAPKGKKRLGKISYCEIDIDKKSGYDNSMVFNLYCHTMHHGLDFDFLMKSLRGMKRAIKKEFSYINMQGQPEFLGGNIKVGVASNYFIEDSYELRELIKIELSDYSVTLISNLNAREQNVERTI